ncbi:hypothetical protein MMC18_003384 [Xylographa bjoerkii]|nr:hypothetical protein [Xylographa bjoerkii]
MSDAGSYPDEDVTIDDTDIATVETAVDSLLDKTQAVLRYPFDSSNNPLSRPSTTLSYRFSAEIEISLDTE